LAFEALVDGIIIFGNDERIVYVNPAARRIFELDGPTDSITNSIPVVTEGERVGQFEGQLEDQDERGSKFALQAATIQRILQGRKPTDSHVRDILITTLTGRDVLLSVYAQPMHDAEGHAVGSVMVIREVTEVDVPHLTVPTPTTDSITRVDALMGLAYRIVDQQRLLAYTTPVDDEPIQRSAMPQSDPFFAIAMHELRNVMAILRGHVGMLSEGVASGKRFTPTKWQMETIKATEQTVGCLVELTDNILDVIRLQTGQFEVRCYGADLAALVRRVAKRLQVTSLRHSIDVSMTAASVIVQMDVRRIEQVLTNLIGNAVKYSPDGGEIAVTVREDRRNHLAFVTVLDHGIGIPADAHGRVFQRFGRAANARELEIDGTGLGLYLCREIVESHGGLIWFRSGAHEGTTFHFSLPTVVGAHEIPV
jgi:signal transduction histidine kinase